MNVQTAKAMRAIDVVAENKASARQTILDELASMGGFFLTGDLLVEVTEAAAELREKLPAWNQRSAAAQAEYDRLADELRTLRQNNLTRENVRPVLMLERQLATARADVLEANAPLEDAGVQLAHLDRLITGLHEHAPMPDTPMLNRIWQA